MTEFVTALKTAYDNSPELRAVFPGGLRADIAPEGTHFPYLVYSVQACPVMFAYVGETAYRPTIKFTAYGDKDQCGPGNTNFELVDAVLAEGLEVPGKLIDWLMPSGRPVARYIGKNAKGGDLWQTSVTYDYSVS